MSVFSWLIPNVPIPKATYLAGKNDLVSHLSGSLLEVLPASGPLLGLVASEVAAEHDELVRQVAPDCAPTVSAAGLFEAVASRAIHVVSMDGNVVWYRGPFAVARFLVHEGTRFWILQRSSAPDESFGGIGTHYEFADEGQTVADGDASEFASELLADALQRHARLQNKVARWLIADGLEPRSPGEREPRFDIAWTDKGCAFVAEVKSLTAENEVRQIRYGMGQVLDYASRTSAIPVLFLDRLPSDVALLRAARIAGIRVVVGEELMFRRPGELKAVLSSREVLSQ